MNIPFLSRLKAGPKASAPAADADAARVQALRAALPELLAAAVIDIESGKALAAFAANPRLDPAKAAPHNAEVVRQKRQALRALALPNEQIEDILISLREQLHLLRICADHRRLLYLVVSTHDTNLALARDVLRAQSL